MCTGRARGGPALMPSFCLGLCWPRARGVRRYGIGVGRNGSSGVGIGVRVQEKPPLLAQKVREKWGTQGSRGRPGDSRQDVGATRTAEPLAFEELRFADHEQRGLRQAFEDGEVAFIEGEGVRRENLKQSDHIPLIAEGSGGDGANAETVADFLGDSPIGLSVITTQCFSFTDALSGES